MIRTPVRPVPSPSMSSPFRRTASVAFGTFTMMPFVPDTSTPASKPSELMVIALVIVTPPKPPGSSTLISPCGAVFEIAPAKVLHGAVRLHGLASSPTPETQVRVACALAGAAARVMAMTPKQSVAMDSSDFLMSISLSSLSRSVTADNIPDRALGESARQTRITSIKSFVTAATMTLAFLEDYRVVCPRVVRRSPVQAKARATNRPYTVHRPRQMREDNGEWQFARLHA